MRLDPTRLIRHPLACSAIFSFACCASANLLLAAWLERPGDPLRHGLFGLVNVCAVLTVLLVALGHLSESGDSRPLRSLAFMAFLGVGLGLFPPVTFLLGLACSVFLGPQGMVG